MPGARHRSRPRRDQARTALVALLAAGALASGPACAPSSSASPGAVTLAWQFRPGDVHTYLMTQHSRTAIPMGDMMQTQTIRVRQEVLRVADDGTADVRVTYDAIRSVQDGPMGREEYDSEAVGEPTGPMERMLAMMVGASYEVTMAPDGEVLRVSGVEEFLQAMMDVARGEWPADAGEMQDAIESSFDAERLAAHMQQQVHVLPSAPVSPGDEWSAELTVHMPFGAVQAVYAYRLDDVVTRHGRRVALIAMTGSTGEMEVDPGNPMAAMLEMEISAGDIDGTIEFDVDRGLLLGMSATTAMTVSAMGMAMPVETTSEMERIEE